MTFDITQANSNDNLTASEALLAELINNYRVQNGLSVLRLSSGLSAIANRHAEDIVYNTHVISHAWSNQPGVGDGQAAQNAGALLNIDYPTSSYSGEENIAGYSDPTLMQTLQISPYATLTGWEQSPSHNENLLGNVDGVILPQASLGIGIIDGVAVAKFGQAGDPVGAPSIMLQGTRSQYTVTNDGTNITVVDSVANRDPTFTLPDTSVNSLIFTDTTMVISGAVPGPNAPANTSTTIITPSNAPALSGISTDYTIIGTTTGMQLTNNTTGTVTQIEANGSNEVQFSDGSLGIPDPTGQVSEVARLYQAAFNRTPDSGGLLYWSAQLQSGVPLNSIASYFNSSGEFQSTYGSLSDADFVNQLYENVLHRAADSSGLSFWEQSLSSGTDRGTVLQDFAESPENESATLSMAGDINNSEALRLYQAAFNRAPDSSGISYWSSVLASGATELQVAQGFTESSEFTSKYSGMSNTDFVNALYQNVLGRTGESSGVAFWSGQLDSGASQAQVLQGFADSPENKALTAGSTHDGWVFLKA